MRFSSKGQGLSLNVIIIAVIALIVLVVLVFIFSGKIKIFREGVSNCGGECIDKGNYQSEFEACNNYKMKNGVSEYTYSPSGVCPDINPVCCIKPLN